MQKLRRARVRRFRSGLEDTVIADLEKRGIEYEYEPRTFDFPQRVRRGVCGECDGREVYQIRRYTPDLHVRDFYIELKGKLTGEIRSRMEGFLNRFGPNGSAPEQERVDLRFIFQRDNWITKAHKARYSDWAKKLGLKYHVGNSVPEEWLQ